MKFHDNRGMYDKIAKWLEENDVEVDWEAVMQCKWWVGPKDWVPPPKWSMPVPFPSRLTPQTATKLLFTQWWHGLYIRPELGDPLDNYVAPRMTSHQIESLTCHQQKGGEGVEPGPAGDAATGPSPWKIFLKQLAAIDRIEITELKLITAEDRRALVRMAWIEEELRRREVEHNRERVKRQNRGEAKWTMSRKSEKWLRERACRGNLVAIEEMERKGYGSVEEHGKWRELNRRLVARAAKARGVMAEKRKEKEMVKERGGELKEKVDPSVEGSTSTPAIAKALGIGVSTVEKVRHARKYSIPEVMMAFEEEKTAATVDQVIEVGEADLELNKELEEEHDANKGAEGEADTEKRGTVIGGALGLEESTCALETGNKGVQRIERELEVVRVGPNPRILTCRYKELASERVCKVGVKSTANFVCGMKFRMAEPSDSLEFASVWRYEGKLPRAKGRW
jgi:hypothetical protein